MKLLIVATFFLSGSAFAGQTEFVCKMISNDNVKSVVLDQKTQNYANGDNAGWGTQVVVGKQGQSVGYMVTISDNSDRLFVSAVMGTVIDEKSFSVTGPQARAISGLPLTQGLHLDLGPSGMTLNVDCVAK